MNSFSPSYNYLISYKSGKWWAFIGFCGGYLLYIGVSFVLSIGFIFLKSSEVAPLISSSEGAGIEALMSIYGEEMLLLNTIAQAIGFAGFALLLTRYIKDSSCSFFNNLGLNGISKVWVCIGLFIFFWVVSLPVLSTLDWVISDLGLFPHSFVESDETIGKLLYSMILDLDLLPAFLFIALTPAICEELLFRGVILGLLLRSYSPIVACLVSGFLFAIMHGVLSSLFSLWFAGFMLGWLTYKTASLIPAMILHLIHNMGFVMLIKYQSELFSPDIALHEIIGMQGIFITFILFGILAYITWRFYPLYHEKETIKFDSHTNI